MGGGTRGFPHRRAVVSIAGGLAALFGAVWRPAGGPWHQGARCAGAAHAVTGYDKEFPSKFAAAAVGQGDTAAPRRPLPIPMVKPSSAFLGQEAASLVIAALAA